MLALAAPAVVLAQQAGPATAPAAGQQWQGHSHGMMRMMQNLNLSDAQKSQIQQIMQKFRQSHAQGVRPTQAERDQVHQQVMNVLTPAQRTQFQQNLQQMRREHEDRGGAPSTPQP
jgi:Spy/CpxP family protein refolding chaperone